MGEIVLTTTSEILDYVNSHTDKAIRTDCMRKRIYFFGDDGVIYSVKYTLKPPVECRCTDNTYGCQDTGKRSKKCPHRTVCAKVANKLYKFNDREHYLLYSHILYQHAFGDILKKKYAIYKPIRDSYGITINDLNRLFVDGNTMDGIMKEIERMICIPGKETDYKHLYTLISEHMYTEGISSKIWFDKEELVHYINITCPMLFRDKTIKDVNEWIKVNKDAIIKYIRIRSETEASKYNLSNDNFKIISMRLLPTMLLDFSFKEINNDK